MTVTFPALPGQVEARFEGDPEATGTRTLELWNTETAFQRILRWQVASEPALYAEAVGDRLIFLPRAGVSPSEIERRLRESKRPVSILRYERDYVVLAIDDPVEFWPSFQEMREEMAFLGELEAELIYRTRPLTARRRVHGSDVDELAWIGARETWADGLEDDQTRVAVIDTGVDPAHPTLRNRLVLHPQGHLKGWNLVRPDTDPLDDFRNGHGTYCASLIAGDPMRAFKGGVLRRGRVIPIKALDRRGMGSAQDVAAAILLAARSGAKVISASWNNFSYSSLIRRRIKQAGDLSCLFVTAAGNDGNNLDDLPSYPACYRLANVLVVGALTDALEPLPDGGRGHRSVHLSAPGQTVHGAEPTYRDRYDPYQDLSGTSVATAIVAGCAALVQDAARFYKGNHVPPTEIKSLLVQSSVPLDRRYGDISCSRGYVNLQNAVGMVAGTFQPANPPVCP